MKNIGFIGLGNMGKPMSKNLIDTGYTVYGLDLNSEAEASFVKSGGILGTSIANIVNHCEVVMTSLPSNRAVEFTYLGKDGLIENGYPGLALIDTSTVAPELNQKIEDAAREKEIVFLAAPVSGGVIGAINRTLTIMVGGPKQAYDRTLPLLQKIGENIFHVGEKIDSGTTAKLINNLLIGFYTAGVSEALNLAAESNLNLESLFQMLNVSYGQSRIYERNYNSFIVKDDYEPGFSLKLLNKDLGFALELAERNHLELPASKFLFDVYKEVEKDGFGEKDMAVLYKTIRERKTPLRTGEE